MEKKKRTAYKEPKFYLESKKESQTAAIFLKYTFAKGQRISYYTGLRIDPDKWSLETQRVKRNVTEAGTINDILNKLEETASKAERESRLQKKPLTKEALKKSLDIANNKPTAGANEFFELFTEFVQTESEAKAWTVSTLKKLKTIRTQLEAFEDHKGERYQLDINRFDNKLFSELIVFLRTEYNLRNSSIQKYIQLIRWFLKWAYINDKANDNFKKAKVKLTVKEPKAKVVYVSKTEQEQILELNIKSGYLNRTRDIFIFQCQTGLRFSDLQNLKETNIRRNTDGTPIEIIVDTIKTGESVKIPLNTRARTILNKYKKHHAATGKALPVPVNQVYNRFLKELAQLAGLKEAVTLVHFKGSKRIEETFEKWQLICTHTARRSFITNLLIAGVSPLVIRSMTGHKSDKAFKDYYELEEVVKSNKQADIDKIDI
jgi:integrase